jgi:uncharacterized protein YggE
MKSLYIFGLLLLSAAYYVTADIMPPLITVSGTGEVKVEPTEAQVSIGVELHDKDLDDLRNQIDKTTSDIIAYLKKQGIAAKYIQTSYITISPHYPENDNSGNTNPDYYIGQKSMTFLLQKLDSYDSVMSGLYKLGLNAVNGITFQVADEATPTLESKKLAVADAKNSAQAMAEELGVKLGKVYSISEYSYSQPIMEQEEDNEEVSSEDMVLAGPSIAGGQISFSYDINVAFYIDQ